MKLIKRGELFYKLLGMSGLVKAYAVYRRSGDMLNLFRFELSNGLKSWKYETCELRWLAEGFMSLLDGKPYDGKVRRTMPPDCPEFEPTIGQMSLKSAEVIVTEGS
jgi:hypothetical protein